MDGQAVWGQEGDKGREAVWGSAAVEGRVHPQRLVLVLGGWRETCVRGRWGVHH